MDWNDLLEKVKKTSSEAVDKAKDTTKRLATISDLKSKIRGYNNDKNKLFTQMGMDIYIAKKQGNDINEQTEEFVKKIDILNARIKKLEERLKLVESSETPDEKADDETGDDLIFTGDDETGDDEIFTDVDYKEEDTSDNNVVSALPAGDSSEKE